MNAIKTIALSAVFLATGAMVAHAVAPPPGNGRITHARDRPQPLGCNALVQVHAGEIWQGLFVGSRTGSSANIRRRVGGKFCFPKVAECQAWLYDMQSMNEGPIRASECRRVR